MATINQLVRKPRSVKAAKSANVKSCQILSSDLSCWPNL